jgi:FkbM family methyltransferase
MIKSILLNFPPIYEAIQALRDRRFHRLATRKGSFSQHHEDVKLLDFLQRTNATGPYLDVGCNHPFRLSNTYMLYTNGWRGLCVDPLPRFRPLYKRWRPEDVFCCAAVGDSEGDLPLYEFESDVLTTLDADLAKSYQAKGSRLLKTSSVKVLPINRLLEESKVASPLSLLSIDIEGHELPALRSIDLDRWQPAIVCMEALTADGRKNESAIEYLTSNRYQTELDLGLNIVFRRTI